MLFRIASLREVQILRTHERPAFLDMEPSNQKSQNPMLVPNRTERYGIMPGPGQLNPFSGTSYTIGKYRINIQWK